MAKDTALIVIDVQQGLLNPDFPVHDATGLLARLAGLIGRARAAGVPVIYVQHNEDEEGGLQPGGNAWRIHPAVAPLEGEPVVQKRTPDSFHETTLQSELAARSIRKLVLCGCQTDFCVDTTCRRAFSLGYDVTLVKDGHSTYGHDDLSAEQIIRHHNAILGGWGASVKSAAEISF